MKKLNQTEINKKNNIEFNNYLNSSEYTDAISNYTSSLKNLSDVLQVDSIELFNIITNGSDFANYLLMFGGSCFLIKALTDYLKNSNNLNIQNKRLDFIKLESYITDPNNYDTLERWIMDTKELIDKKRIENWNETYDGHAFTYSKKARLKESDLNIFLDEPCLTAVDKYVTKKDMKILKYEINTKK